MNVKIAFFQFSCILINVQDEIRLYRDENETRINTYTYMVIQYLRVVAHHPDPPSSFLEVDTFDDSKKGGCCPYLQRREWI